MYPGRSARSRNGSAVATTARPGSRSLTRSGCPRVQAPAPRIAENDRSSIGPRTTATTGRLASTSAIEIATTGKPRRKFVVPSSGSTTQ